MRKAIKNLLILGMFYYTFNQSLISEDKKFKGRDKENYSTMEIESPDRFGAIPQNYSEVLPEGYISLEEVKEHISKEYLRMEYISKKAIEKIVKKESNFNIFAVNKRTKAKGLMQILEPTWDEVNPGVPYEKGVFIPKENIKTGIKYLRDLTYLVPKKNPNWDNLGEEEKTAQILACYNWGIGKLERNSWNLSKSPKETKDYIRFVLGHRVN